MRRARGHIHTTGEQHIQHIVEAGGVGAGAVYQRCDRLDIRQTVGLKPCGARIGPVAIALDGIDLAIVCQQTKGLGQGPARHGIGGKALVKHADGGLQPLIIQIQIKARQIHRHHQALVGNNPPGEAADIEFFVRSLAISALRRATNSLVARSSSDIPRHQ